MTMRNSVERDWGRLVRRILSLGPESEIVEYKENNADPEMIDNGSRRCRTVRSFVVRPMDILCGVFETMLSIWLGRTSIP